MLRSASFGVEFGPRDAFAQLVAEGTVELPAVGGPLLDAGLVELVSAVHQDHALLLDELQLADRALGQAQRRHSHLLRDVTLEAELLGRLVEEQPRHQAVEGTGAADRAYYNEGQQEQEEDDRQHHQQGDEDHQRQEVDHRDEGYAEVPAAGPAAGLARRRLRLAHPDLHSQSNQRLHRFGQAVHFLGLMSRFRSSTCASYLSFLKSSSSPFGTSSSLEGKKAGCCFFESALGSQSSSSNCLRAFSLPFFLAKWTKSGPRASSIAEKCSTRLLVMRVKPSGSKGPLEVGPAARATRQSLQAGSTLASCYENFFTYSCFWVHILESARERCWSSGMESRTCFLALFSSMIWAFLRARSSFWAVRLWISWESTSTQVRRPQFCSSPLMKVVLISSMSVMPVASLMTLKASSMAFIDFWQLSISFTFSLLFTISLSTLFFSTLTVSVSMWSRGSAFVLCLLSLYCWSSSISFPQNSLLSFSCSSFSLSIYSFRLASSSPKRVISLPSRSISSLFLCISSFIVRTPSVRRIFSSLRRSTSSFCNFISPRVSLRRLSRTFACRSTVLPWLANLRI